MTKEKRRMGDISTRFLFIDLYQHRCAILNFEDRQIYYPFAAKLVDDTYTFTRSFLWFEKRK